MSEDELKVLAADKAVIRYVNNNMGTNYTLEQQDSTANKIVLKRGDITVRCGTLREVTIHIAGMFDLAIFAIGRKE